MLKRIIVFLALTTLTLVSCKEKTSPEGPTDIRIKNLSDVTFTSVTVNTSGGTNDYPELASGAYTEYKRFEKAYPIAEITAIIGGETYSTGTQNYNYQVVLGQGKFVYEVFIENALQKKLAISRVIAEAPLK